MKSFISMFIILIAYLTSTYFLGITKVMFLMSIIFLFMAVLFTLNKKYYYKYFSFINPRFIEIANKKGDKYKKNNRLINIISYYILSVLMFVNGLIRTNSRLDDIPLKYVLNSKYFITMGIVLLIIGVIVYFANNYFIKKSKNNVEYTAWSFALGIALVGIVFIVIRAIY